jgi:predicted nucleotidyltransferase
MDSLAQTAAALSIPERTLRRAAREGLLRGERISPRRFRITLREEAYLRSHWQLLHTLRRALRTEPNVRLAVLFGSTAMGDDHERSDIDLLVVLHDPAVRRLVELAQRLSRHIARNVQLVRLAEAEKSPLLLADAINQGRVLVDREGRWPDLRQSAKKWQRRARHAEQPLSAAMDELTLD